MTIQELIEKCNELGIEIHHLYMVNNGIGTLRLYYNSVRFGEIIYKNNYHHIHSHYWKKQDENISKVKLESFDKAMSDFILFVKNKYIKNRIKKIEKDFV